MAPIGTLYMYDTKSPGAHRAARILAVAAFTGAEITILPGYKHKETNLTKEFQEKFPIQMVPAFETAEGGTISEGSAIAQYIAAATSSSLYPTSPLLQAQIAQWQSFTDTELLPPLLAVYGVSAGFVPAPKEFQIFSFKKAVNSLRKLDDLFKSKQEKGEGKFLVGGQLSLADIAVASALTRAYANVFDSAIQKQYPNVLAYYLSIIQLAVFKDVWGGVVLSEKSTIDLSE